MTITKRRRPLERKVRPTAHADTAALDEEAKAMPTVTRLANVPEQRYYEEYISREIEGVLDMDVLKLAYESAYNVLIYGPTGPGKTSMVLAFAAREKLPFYSVASNIALDPSQMFGKMGVTDNGQFAWFDGGVTDLVRYGGVLLINEVNFMSNRVAPVLYELFDKRREITLLDHNGEKLRAHRPDCWCDLPRAECKKHWILIVADMNPGYQGTVEMNTAFRNRFPIQFEVNYNPLVEEKLVSSSVLRDIVTKIRAQVGRTLETPVTTNAMVEFEKIARSSFGVKWAVSNFVNHFDNDEKAIVKSVFDTLMNDLLEDFKPEPPGAELWNQFEGANAMWMEDED
jgi:MoxR-like ATPase